MIEKLLSWLLPILLEWLLKKSKEAVKEAKSEHEQDKTDASNVEKYEKAKTRKEQIQAATDILSGTKRG